MKLRRAHAAVLAIPALFLLVSADRVAVDRETDLQPYFVNDWVSAAQSFPGRNEGRFGLPGDPLNLIFVGRPEVVISALKSAGWTPIPGAFRDSAAAGISEWLGGRTIRSFPPMNDYRLAGRRQNMNWAIVVRPFAERHHFRLWWTGAIDGRGRWIWWGSANYDRSIRWRDLSHRPDPDADAERDFVASTLAVSPLLESRESVAIDRIPLDGVNDKGYPFRTDGRATAIILTTPSTTPRGTP